MDQEANQLCTQKIKMKKLLLTLIFFLIIPFALTQTCENGEVEECIPNKGICEGSTRTCFSGIWGACSILPKEEVCNNDLDDDCDGKKDEECVCKDGETRQCQVWSLGVCSASKQTCKDNAWSACNIQPTQETCNNLADDDCDGDVDLEDSNCFDPMHCRNGIKDYDETDIDCGGSLCLPCPSCTNGKLDARIGEKKVNVIVDDKGTKSDCGGQCPPCPTCNDGTKNQLEENIDCGGPNCPECFTDEPLPTPTEYCGDGICNENEDSELCPEDCKSNFGFMVYFLIFFILIAILLLLYILLKLTTGAKKKKKQPPIKIHSSLLKPLSENKKTDYTLEKLKKIK